MEPPKRRVIRRTHEELLEMTAEETIRYAAELSGLTVEEYLEQWEARNPEYGRQLRSLWDQVSQGVDLSDVVIDMT